MRLDKLVKTTVDALEDIKGRDIVVLDVRRMTALFDKVIVVSGDSARQNKALANNVQEKAKALGATVHGVGAGRSGRNRRPHHAAGDTPALQSRGTLGRSGRRAEEARGRSRALIAISAHEIPHRGGRPQDAGLDQRRVRRVCAAHAARSAR
jgi:hypothetical protein